MSTRTKQAIKPPCVDGLAHHIRIGSPDSQGKSHGYCINEGCEYSKDYSSKVMEQQWNTRVSKNAPEED